MTDIIKIEKMLNQDNGQLVIDAVMNISYVDKSELKVDISNI